MSVLADVFAAVRLQLDQAGFAAQATKAADSAGTTMGQRLSASIKKSWSGANIGQGLVQGLGLAGGLGATVLASKAISGLTDIIGDSIAAAREDQASQQALATALRNNVPAWDGNTAAIEKTLQARIKLGVSDDEQRIGLATLVAATHDATKALDLEAGALDIARARHVDLATASDAVAKAYAGNTKGLKSLLPGLKLGATATETLANAFGMVKGAAEDYAKTDEGRLLVAQTKLNEAMEKFGYTVMPAVTDAMTGAATAASALFDAIDILQNGISKDATVATEQAQSFVDLERAVAVLIPPFGMLADAEEREIEARRKAFADNGQVGRSAGKMADDVVSASEDIVGAIGDMEAASTDWRDRFRDDSGAVIRSANKVRTKFSEIAQGIIDAYYDPLELEATRHDQRLKLFADLETLRTAKTREEKRQARDDIISDLHDEATTLASLGSQGKLTASDVQRFTKDARSQYGSMSKSAIADTEAIITKLEELAGLHPKVKITLDVQMSAADKALLQKVTHHAAGHGPLQFAEGGFRPAGIPSWVGERGPELSVPLGSSLIIPHDQSVAMAGGLGETTNHFAITVNGVGSDVSSFAARRFAQTILDTVADGLREQTARTA